MLHTSGKKERSFIFFLAILLTVFSGFTLTGCGNGESASSAAAQGDGAGLYDAGGRLIVNWNYLVNRYDLDIERNYNPPIIGKQTDRQNAKETSLAQLLNEASGAVLPKGITRVGNAFSGSKGLEKATLPEGVKTIGSGAFAVHF